MYNALLKWVDLGVVNHSLLFLHMIDEPCQMIISKAKLSNWNAHVDSVGNIFIVFIGL